MNQPIRVLLVDDQPSARKGLRAILTFFPQILVVGEAVNGQEAVQLVAEQQPHVVVMRSADAGDGWRGSDASDQISVACDQGDRADRPGDTTQ